MITFKTAFIIEEKPNRTKHRLFSLTDELPCMFVASIDLVNTSTTRNNKVNRIKVSTAHETERFVVLSQNELDNLLSQCKIKSDYKPILLV